MAKPSTSKVAKSAHATGSPRSRAVPVDYSRCPDLDSARQTIAAYVTRDAIATYLNAKRCFEEVERRTTGDDRLERWWSVSYRRFTDAQRNLIRTIVAWMSFSDEHAISSQAFSIAEQCYFPPRGVVYQGVIYMAVPNEPENSEGLEVGEEGKHGDDVMMLQVVDLADLAQLDPAGVVDIDPLMSGATRPEEAATDA